MKTIALIQARMSSSRLPGKVLQDIAGQPMLLRVVQRAKRAQTVDLVAVITSNCPADDAVEELCLRHSIPCYRGSLDDVLDRYYQAAVHFHADAIVRITADCPLLDPAIVDQTVRTFRGSVLDYASNTLECTYPDGLDTEVFKFAALARAWREAALKSEREHVTAYLYKHPEIFRLGSLKQQRDLSALRWTVDTLEDLKFVNQVYQQLGHAEFGMEEILVYLEAHPTLMGMNAGQMRNEGYQKSLYEDKSER